MSGLESVASTVIHGNGKPKNTQSTVNIFSKDVRERTGLRNYDTCWPIHFSGCGFKSCLTGGKDKSQYFYVKRLNASEPEKNSFIIPF